MKAGQLAENISKIIDVQFSDNVDMSSVQVTINSFLNQNTLQVCVIAELKR